MVADTVQESGERGEDAAIGLGCSYDRFSEVDEVADLMSTAWDQVGGEGTGLQGVKQERKAEQLLERWKFIFDAYQEQPHLIDPHLATILDNLVDKIRKHQTPEQLSITTQLLFHITKVRGYKVVVRHFPHEVEDLEFVVSLLQAQDDGQAWQTRYVLLIWLSIIVIIPFDMARFDSGNQEPLADRILTICKAQLKATDKSQDAAGFLASKFVTRPDIRESALPAFIDWALSSALTENARDHDITGGLMALASVVKHSKREDMLPHASVILERILKCNLKENPNTLIRKLALKLVQRLGLIFLKSRIAAWRYQRGSRSLTINLSLETPNQAQPKVVNPQEEEDDYDVPEEIEDVIEELLNGLRDPETVVRWTSAKGIGRVTGRLPNSLADEVVGSLLEMFGDRETDSAWHGACLAIAELGRRGLLLPNRLQEVITFITKALVFDEKRGSFSVGSHIRDAACYVCWAFARAYEPDVLKPYVQELASNLLIVTVFDREVNCRRAASAAFQENVGRQGTFPHGIDILTTADYFSVGQRSNAYLKISAYIGGFGEYSKPLLSHLLARKVGHWDPAVRDLAAKALNRLAHCDLEYVVGSILPKLLEMCLCPDLFSAHGATLAVGEIMISVREIVEKEGKSVEEKIGSALAKRVENLVSDLIQGNKLRGLGGELMRLASCEFIANCSNAKLDIPHTVVLVWKGVLDESLSDADQRVVAAAVAAVPVFTSQYYIRNGTVEVTARDKLLAQYYSMLKGNENHRKGFALAFGSLDIALFEGRYDEVILNLIQCTKSTQGTEKWAESRRDAVKALTNVGTKLSDYLSTEMLHHIYDCFMISLEDYTLDRRGDVGAWVREAAMTGIEQFTLKLLNTSPQRIPPAIVAQFMPCLAQQAVEKIDRTRGVAGRIFHALLHAKSAEGSCIPGIRDRDTLESVFPADRDVKWAVESESFPLFVKLLRLKNYNERLLLGLVVSVGGLTERLVKNSSQCLFNELGGMNSAGIKQFCTNILGLFHTSQKNDRVTVPMLKFLDLVFTSSSLSAVLQDESSEFPISLLNLVKAEISKCGDPNKLMASSEIFCQLLQAEDSQCLRKCLIQISIFLCHRFPRVRKYTADKFYEALLTFADRPIIPDEHLDDVMSLLGETNWIETKVEDLRTIRNKICDYAGVPVPMMAKKPQ